MSRIYDRTGTQLLVVHYLGDNGEPAGSAEELQRRANPDGWQFPDYDFGVLGNGSVISLRPLTYIGAHTVSDIPAMENGIGPKADSLGNWWNRNSASIVLGWGKQGTVPAAMLQGLAGFIQNWIKERGGAFNTTVLPHNHITRTDCPGFNFEEVAAMLNKNVPVVVFYGPEDMVNALRLSRKVQGVLIERDVFNGWSEADKTANTVYVVGGEPLTGSNIVNLAGADWNETTKLVLNRL